MENEKEVNVQYAKMVSRAPIWKVFEASNWQFFSSRILGRWRKDIVKAFNVTGRKWDTYKFVLKNGDVVWVERNWDSFHQEISAKPNKMAWVLGLVLLFFSSNVKAFWKNPSNPDKYLSFGLSVENAQVGGAYSAVSRPNMFSLRESGYAADTYTGWNANLRIPATSNVTFDVNYTLISGSSTHDRNNGIYQESSTLNGYRTNFGMRYYFKD